ncbi:permease [Massilia agilis]|uniref:Permease n=1 Tax=Massilia agilis TaxID=1811226 RepID=A0ABT2DHC2_9BURK|nr:permease [Massilia agilis]MCS0810700.1 permease [Massilia agilis]
MQRALSFDTTPPLSIPLRFMLTAPWFAAAAGLLLLWSGAPALQSRWSGPMLALTHLMTLGFLAMTMLGAMLQMLPVVAESPFPRPRAVAWVSWLGLVGGTPLLAAALLGGPRWLFAAAPSVLGLALLVFVAGAARALARRTSPGALPMAAGMRLAVPGFFLTIVLGLSLAVFLAGGPALPVMAVTDLHAALGLLGWVAMLVMAAGFQVIPMFQATPVYRRAASFALPPALALLLCAWGAAGWLRPAWQALAGYGVALVLAGFAGYSLWLLSKSRRTTPDITTWYWRLSLGSLLCCALVYAWPGIDPDRKAVLLGVLFVAGFATSAVNGMLYKIVPFLLWYHLGSAGVARARVPGVNNWIGARAAKRQYAAHAAAVAALCVAVVVPVLARAAGALFAAQAAWIGTILAGAALRYRRIITASALERA